MTAIAQPANAAFPGPDGLIAYGAWATPERVEHELFTVRPDGTANQRLELTPGADPAWSSDGGWLAFSRPYGREIWTARVDGSSPQQFIALPAPWHSVRRPAWAPHGRRIAFDAARPLGSDGETERVFVWTADRDGGTTRLREGSRPVWSPDGRVIAYLGRKYDSIRLMRPDGSDPRTLTRIPTFPAGKLEFSPDGRRLLFVNRPTSRATSPTLGVVNRRTGATRRLPVTGTPIAADWAPSGNRIVYLLEPKYGAAQATPPTEVWTMRTDGSRQRRLLTLPGKRWAESISWQPRRR